MTTPTNHADSALLVIDVQIGVVADAYQRDERIANIALAVQRARGAGVPVIWIQHNDEHLLRDSDNWLIVPELEPAPGEPIVHKSFRSAFEETTLESLLEDLGSGHLYICGAQTNYCVRNTIHAGYERAYDITLIHDAHTTSDDSYGQWSASAEMVINDANLTYYSYDLPGRVVRISAAAELFA